MRRRARQQAMARLTMKTERMKTQILLKTNPMRTRPVDQKDDRACRMQTWDLTMILMTMTTRRNPSASPA